MNEQEQVTLSDICDCECHEYGHLKHCECCLLCHDCGEKIKHYDYVAHVNENCPTKKLLAQRLP